MVCDMILHSLQVKTQFNTMVPQVARLESLQNAHGRRFNLQNIVHVTHASLDAFEQPVFEGQKLAQLDSP